MTLGEDVLVALSSAVVVSSQDKDNDKSRNNSIADAHSEKRGPGKTSPARLKRKSKSCWSVLRNPFAIFPLLIVAWVASTWWSAIRSGGVIPAGRSRSPETNQDRPPPLLRPAAPAVTPNTTTTTTVAVASKQLPHVVYPPMSSVVEKINDVRWNVTSDVRFLLNFSIAGFPKCGTSTMMEYLEKSPYTKVAQKEKCELGYGRQAKLVRDLYEELPEGRYVRGIKCPRDLENEFSMQNYQKYFRDTHFLVGLRHPVDWFQSFYNFRVYNNNPMPPPEKLIGSCAKYSRHVCTHRARFHLFLANFGKTPLGYQERQFFPHGGNALRVKHTKNTIFLYHVEQLKDKDEARQLQLRQDLTSFLGLPELLPRMDVWTKPGKNLSTEQLEKANSLRLNICDPQHDHVRSVLIEQGRNSAEWILQYFLESPDVFVSSPDFFKELTKAWESDPCDKK